MNFLPVLLATYPEIQVPNQVAGTCESSPLCWYSTHHKILTWTFVS